MTEDEKEYLRITLIEEAPKIFENTKLSSSDLDKILQLLQPTTVSLGGAIWSQWQDNQPSQPLTVPTPVAPNYTLTCSNLSGDIAINKSDVSTEVDPFSNC